MLVSLTAIGDYLHYYMEHILVFSLCRGHFVKLFNATDCSGTPSQGDPFVLTDIETKLKPQTDYRSASVSAVEMQADRYVLSYSSTSYLMFPFASNVTYGALGFGFRSSADRGAALVVSEDGIKRTSLIRKQKIETYVKKHYASWVAFASAEGYRFDKLFFVSGCWKAKEWFAVAFKSGYTARSVASSFDVVNFLGLRLQRSQETSSTGMHHWGPLNPDEPPSAPSLRLLPLRRGSDASNALSRTHAIGGENTTTHHLSLERSRRASFDQCVKIERHAAKSARSWAVRMLGNLNMLHSVHSTTSSEESSPPQPDDAGSTSPAPPASQLNSECETSGSTATEGNEYWESETWVNCMFQIR
jgi:hypothetical protein